MDSSKIHPTAIIGNRVELADDVEVGAYSIIEGKTTLGVGTVVGSHCHIGVQTKLANKDELIIGSDSLIRSHSVFYTGSSFGKGLTTGHRVTVRENTNAGEGFHIGTLGDIQGHCVIGDHVRCHSNVHVGQGSSIGNFVWIFPYTVLTNDPHPPSKNLEGCTINDYAAIATMSVILPGVIIDQGALVGASSLVRTDVPADTICVGNPGRNIGQTSKIKLKGTELPAYPWRRHFHRGYPEEIVSSWKQEFGNV